MNPTQSLSSLVLLFLLSIYPMISTIAASKPHHHHHHHNHHHHNHNHNHHHSKPVAPCGSSRGSHNKGVCFRAWCKKAMHSNLCTSIVEANSQECWKMNPEGVALILIKAAKASQERTVEFIKSNLENVTDVDVRQGLEHCLFGYSTVGKMLDISICDLSDPDSRSDAYMALRQVDDEVTYDCEWYQPNPFPQILNEMFKRVNRFSAILLTAQEIMQLI